MDQALSPQLIPMVDLSLMFLTRTTWLIMIPAHGTGTPTRISSSSTGRVALWKTSRSLNPDNYWFIQTVCKSPTLNDLGDLAAFACASGYHISYRERFLVYLYDRLSGSLGLITQGLRSLVNDTSGEVVISADGSTLLFTSNASNLVTADTDRSRDIYLYNIQNSTLELASINSHGEKGNGASTEATVSHNGQRIAYVSESDNLVRSRHIYDSTLEFLDGKKTA